MNFKNKILEYIASYKLQLKFAPMFKNDMKVNPVHFSLLGKIEFAEKLLDDYNGKRI